MSYAHQRIRGVDLNKPLRVDTDDSIEQLTAAMLFPDEGRAKHCQLLYFREQLTSQPFEDNEYPEDVSSFAKEIKTARTNGVLAGFCLMYFHALENSHYETAAGNRAEPSQRVVFYLCSEHDLGREKWSKGDKRDYNTITDKFAKKIWKRYQRVSHLWASYIHLTTVTKSKLHRHPLEGIDISVMLLLARQYERFITEFFDGEKSIRAEKELITPFKVRYHDWNSDDPLKLTIPKFEFVDDFVRENVPNYVANN
jgi:hypothetical protein